MTSRDCVLRYGQFPSLRPLHQTLSGPGPRLKEPKDTTDNWEATILVCRVCGNFERFWRGNSFQHPISPQIFLFSKFSAPNIAFLAF